MTAPEQICEPWPLSKSCLPECWSVDPAEWTERQADAVDMACEILRAKTGYMYGLCRVTLRPCRREPCRPPLAAASLGVQLGVGWMQPTLIDGRVVNNPCGCAGSCGCTEHRCAQIIEPFITEMIEVRVDGVVVSPDDYEVRDHRKLVRVVGGCWPECQDMSKRDGEPGTWSVTYKTGWRVPAGGRRAVSMLAVEIDKACAPGGPVKGCALSEHVTEVVLDGVTYVRNNLDAIRQGSTGINLVDEWVLSVNPHEIVRPMAVYSPDTVRGEIVTWPAGGGP